MWDNFFPGTMWHEVGNGVSWRLHKHWAANVYAGEGRSSIPEGNDRSGCLFDAWSKDTQGETFGPMQMCFQPRVVEQRIYQRGDRQLSAVFSYPDGIAIMLGYFWEIYPVGGGIERFTEEAEMETRVVELLMKEEEVVEK